MQMNEWLIEKRVKRGSGAGYSVGPYSGKLVPNSVVNHDDMGC